MINDIETTIQKRGDHKAQWLSGSGGTGLGSGLTSVEMGSGLGSGVIERGKMVLCIGGGGSGSGTEFLQRNLLTISKPFAKVR